MKHRVFLLCAALGLTGITMVASPIDGKWTAQVQGAKGPQLQTLALKTDGANVTGTLDTGRGGATSIAEGKFDGTAVSFKVTRAGRNANVTTDYTGKLIGDDLKLTPTREGGTGGKGGAPQELDFKRAK